MSNIEEKRLKRKMDDALTDDDDDDDADLNPSKALQIGSNSMVGESSSRSFKSMRSSIDCDSLLRSSEPSNDRDHQFNENLPLDHSCTYCDRKFSSPQALGGHQNAHKHERLIAKEKNKYMYGDEFGSRYPRHSSYSYSYMTNNYQVSPLNLYHGVQFQYPMSQIPSISTPRLASSAYGLHQGLHFPTTSFNGYPFGSTSSWSDGGSGAGLGAGLGAIPPRSNFQILNLFGPINQISVPIINGADQNQALAGVANNLEDLRVSPEAPQASNEDPTGSPIPQASEELDLTLKLGFP